MTTDLSHPSGSALGERMIEDMSVRGFTEDTRRDYIRCVKAFAAFIGRSPDTATAEDLRCFQLQQTRGGRMIIIETFERVSNARAPPWTRTP